MIAAFRAHPHFQEKVAKSWDIFYGANIDLLVESNLRKLLNLMASGHIEGTWLGTPCTSLSAARRWDGGPPPLRDDGEFLWKGLPGRSERDQAAVEEGNKMVEVVLKVIKEAIEHDVLVILENPATSRMFLVKELKDMIAKYNGVWNVADYCQYGKSWKKRTTFLTFNGTNFGLKRCSGSFGKCSRTRKMHLRLEGRAPDGRFWTKIAEPYPPDLCDHIASSCLRYLEENKKVPRGKREIINKCYQKASKRSFDELYGLAKHRDDDYNDDDKPSQLAQVTSDATDIEVESPREHIALPCVCFDLGMKTELQPGEQGYVRESLQFWDTGTDPQARLSHVEEQIETIESAATQGVIARELSSDWRAGVEYTKKGVKSLPTFFPQPVTTDDSTINDCADELPNDEVLKHAIVNMLGSYLNYSGDRAIDYVAGLDTLQICGLLLRQRSSRSRVGARLGRECPRLSCCCCRLACSRLLRVRLVLCRLGFCRHRSCCHLGFYFHSTCLCSFVCPSLGCESRSLTRSADLLQHCLFLAHRLSLSLIIVESRQR